MDPAVASLPVLAARARPLATAGSRLLEVPQALADVFPEGGLRRGSTVTVGPLAGGCSLGLALAGAVTGAGGWVAVVAVPSLGVAAAVELGVDLGRLALVPAPGGRWVEVVAALVDGFDMVLLRPPGPARPADARRLAARVRERGAVLVVLDASRWPESPDLRLSVGPSAWDGLGVGHGHLRARRLEVVCGGRRAAGRERRRWVWMPAPGGGLAAGEDLVSLPDRAPLAMARPASRAGGERNP